jgi:hypothetical protein
MRTTRHAALGLIVALATFLSANISQAQTASWTSAGSMTTARSYHTATVLGNGKILVAGGLSQAGSTLTAEIYNPTTNTWANTGSMLVPRYMHTATLLKDGRVLVTGGYSGTGRMSSAELYDPTTGIWAATGTMAMPRAAHSAAYLQNGMVLVEGGCCDTVPSILSDLSSAEVWDSATGKWSSAGTLHAPHASGAAYLLSNGDVLVPGGTFMENGGSGPSTDLYSASGGSWSALPNLKQSRSTYAGDVLNEDFVVITGGNAGGCCSGTATAELYDPATQSWQAVPNMSTPRRDHAAVAIANGTQLLVSGGYTCCNDPAATRNSAEIFDLATRTWSTTASMFNPRYGHTLTRIFDGTVLVVGGGIYSSAPYMATAERYHPGGAAAVPVQIIIGSNPNGVGFAVSGANCSAGNYATQATVTWIPGESCAVAVTPLAGYLFDKWNDGSTGNPRTFVAPATPTGYSFTLKTGAPTVAAAGGTPQSTAAGTTFAGRFAAMVRDAAGNPLPNVIVTFTAPAGLQASGTFSGSLTQSALSNGSGLAGAPAFTANSVAGTYSVIASIPGGGTTAAYALTNTAAATASTIAATGGTPQTATIKANFASSLIATVKSSSGIPISGVTVTFSAPASGASLTFVGNANTAVTNAAGVATSSSMVANGTAGSYAVTATAPGVATPAVFSLTNNPGIAATITATAGTPQSATISKAFATALSATVKDSGGNLLSGIAVTFAVPASGASGTFAGAVLTATTNASGVVTSPVFTANATAGSYTVTAAVAGVATKANFALTNTAASTGGKTLVPSSYITTLGASGGQSVAALGIQDQSGSASTWAKYVEFSPKSGSTYAGYQIFTLPTGTTPSSLKTLQLQINYQGPASNGTTWTWQVFNWTTGTWVTVGNNAGAPDWGPWKILTFSVPGTLSNYVRSSDGQMLVQLLSNNAKDSADIDYEALVFTN